MIEVYNSETQRYQQNYGSRENRPDPEDVVDTDSTKIKWTREIYNSAKSGRRGRFHENHVVESVYRPFIKQWAYFDRHFNNCVYQMPSIFPYDGSENRVIDFSGPGASEFSVIMCDRVPNYDLQSKGLCLPRYQFCVASNESDDELDFELPTGEGISRRDAITDAGLKHFQAAYPGETVTKDDLFHYVYGLLHSEDYRERFADNLSKELPRIPAVKRFEDFRAFVEAGRLLGDLHCEFETVEPFPVQIAQGDLRLAVITDPAAFFRVEKMKFHKVRNADGKLVTDKSAVLYNRNITMTDIPLEAYDYVVNGKPALEWVMERQGVKTDKASGIVNDANRYANETKEDPAYPFDLFRRVITVSLETMKIVRGLPPLGDLS
jgi:predicted helicase